MKTTPHTKTRTLTRKVRDAIRRDMRWWEWADWAEENEDSPYDIGRCPYWAHARIGHYHSVGPANLTHESLHRRINKRGSPHATPCSCFDCVYGVDSDFALAHKTKEPKDEEN